MIVRRRQTLTRVKLSDERVQRDRELVILERERKRRRRRPQRTRPQIVGGKRPPPYAPPGYYCAWFSARQLAEKIRRRPRRAQRVWGITNEGDIVEHTTLSITGELFRSRWPDLCFVGLVRIDWKRTEPARRR